MCSGPLVHGSDYMARALIQAALTVSWSPSCSSASGTGLFSLLAVGTKSGKVILWHCRAPRYSLTGAVDKEALKLASTFPTHHGYVTALSWVMVPASQEPDTTPPCRIAPGKQIAGALPFC